MGQEQDLRKRNVKKGVIITLIVIAIIVICICSIFASVKVVGPSMQPNFNGTDGVFDKVIISRIYGLNYGDVIVFKSKDSDKNLIKRVIGLPEDHILIQDGKLFRNGVLIDETGYIKNPMKANEVIDITVGKDEVYVMGDNRNESKDSRAFGPIKKDSIVGEVIVRIDNKNGKIYFL